MASFLPGSNNTSKSPAFPPINNTALNYSKFSLNDNYEDDSDDDLDNNTDDNEISDEESEDESDGYSEDESSEEEDTNKSTYKRARKKMDMIDMDAAKLLLSVSPRIMPSRPRSLSHLEPLESLAGLAMLGESKKKEVEKLRSCLDGISTAPMGSLSSFNFSISQKGNGSNSNIKKKSLKIKFRVKKKTSNQKIQKTGHGKKSKSKTKDANTTSKKKGKKRKRRKKSNGITEHWTLQNDGDNNSQDDDDQEADKGHKNGVPAILHNSRFEKDYNKKGKIGIYTPSQRAALLEKFRAKRRRRVWYKKVRYGCRKNLADRRLRIKGRFVRADSEEYKAYFANLAKKAAEEKAVTQKVKEKLSVIIEGQVTSSDSNSTNTTSMSSTSSESGSSSTETVREAAKPGNSNSISNGVKMPTLPEVTMSKTMMEIMKNNETTSATLALNLSGDDNNTMFMKSDNPNISQTAFSMMANKNGRPRAQSSLL